MFLKIRKLYSTQVCSSALYVGLQYSFKKKHSPNILTVLRSLDRVYTEHQLQILQGSLFDYTGCPRRKVPDFGRIFLKLKYTDITQNTNIRS